MAFRHYARTSFTIRPMRSSLVALVTLSAACVAPGCGSDGAEDNPAVDAGEDAVSDVGADVTADTSVDSRVDTGSVEDTATDATMADAATDSARADVFVDVSTMDANDSGMSPMDSGTDVLPDAGSEAPTFPPFAAKHLSLGNGYSCALINEAVRCWGDNSKGQLGNGTIVGSTTMPATDVIGEALSVSAGDRFTCALLKNRTVKCWGYYFYGSLGDGRSATSSANDWSTGPETAALGVTDVRQLVTGGLHTCVIRGSDAQLMCWGYNDSGQVPDGNVADTKREVPVEIPGPTGTGKMDFVKQVALGHRHTCILRTDGKVYCSGDNFYGQLGDGTQIDRGRPTLANVSDVVEIAAGYTHSCARHSDGTVSCWGQNNNGQVGTPVVLNYTSSTTPGAPPVHDVRKLPLKVAGLSGVVQLALGGEPTSFSCARIGDGTVKCWGRNNLGQTGDGTSADRETDRTSPTTVVGLTGATHIEAGYSHVCAQVAEGDYRCWGSDQDGQLGRGTVFHYTTPARDPGIAGATQIAVGHATSTNGTHACAVLADKTLKCWGRGREGQLGLPVGDEFSPVIVPNMTAVEQIALGEYLSCALRTGGSIQCWGDSRFGALGNGASGGDGSIAVPIPSPVGVSTITTASHIAMGRHFACALTVGGKVSCWGQNASGQIADGTTDSRSTPWELPSLASVTQLDVGTDHACALVTASPTDKFVSCWGENGSSQMGDAAVVDVKSPKKVGLTAGLVPKKVALGERHTCILLEDKTIRCFGANDVGQSGDSATTSNKSAPFTVPGVSNAVDIWAGENFTCYLTDANLVRCFGGNDAGQLADGSFDKRTTPGPALIGLTNFATLAAGRNSACALRTDGTVRCWGGISYGALGDGEGVYRDTPIALTF